MKQSMQITIPHNFTPREYQIDFLASDKRFKVFVVHRRGGKSMTALNAQVMKAVSKKGIYYYFLPTYRQAKQVMWDDLVKTHIPDEVVAKRNESEMSITYTNGSIQRFVGCEDPDKHRGINPIDVVFDEYAESNPRIWKEIIEPVLRENGGSATFIFTPKGKNHAYGQLEFARSHPDKWFCSVKTVYDTQAIAIEELNDARLGSTEALFNQEYLCSFEDGAGAFFRGVRDVTYDPHAVDLVNEGEFQLGVDLAKYNDYTVLTPFNLNTFVAYPQDSFNQVDWNLQKARITSAAYKHSNALMRMDATGVGDPVVEDLRAQGLSFDDKSAFKFTDQSKRNLLNNLCILIEQRKIKIPNDPELIKQLEGFVYEMNKNGKSIIKSTTTHDDRVMSLALAVWGAQDRVEPSHVSERQSRQREYQLYGETYN